MISSVLLMTGQWPHQEFREYLRALMNNAGIADYAELSRLTGLNQSLFSNWRKGQTQPSQQSLRKIAPTLGVSPAKLYIAAGLSGAEELDLSSQPDLRVIPREFQDLIELYDGLSADQQSYARRSVAHLVAGLRAEIGTSKNQPVRRRRPA